MKSHRRHLVLLFLTALLTRLGGWLFLGSERVPWQYEFEVIAEYLLKSGQYAYDFYKLSPPKPTSFIPPLYPLLLAASRAIAHSDTPLILLQILLAAALPLLLVRLALRLGASPRQALLSGWLAALYPQAISYAVLLGTASLEAFFIALGSLELLEAEEAAHPWKAAGAGVCFALAALTRATWLLTLPLALLWLAWRARPRPWRALGMLALAFGVLYTPWVAWNVHTHGRLLLTSTNGGVNFWIGNNPRANGEYIFPTQIDHDFVQQMAWLPEAERDRRFYQAGLGFIREHPQRFVQLFVRKWLYFLFFRPHIGSNYSSISATLLTLARLAFKVSWGLLLPFAVLGWFFLPARRRAAHLWGAFLFLSQGMVAALYFTGTRFRFPLDAFAILWAAIGLENLFRRWVLPRRPPSIPLHAGLVLLVALVHGLIYVFLLPPWQHYEEPSHFELAWMLATTHRRPTYPAYDIPKRLEIGQSMIAHGFYRDIGPPPDPAQYHDQPFPIGINVTGALPLYHAIVAVPLALFRQANVDVQLYLGRLVSLGMYLLTILMAALTIGELTPPGSAYRWAIPLAIALVPGFTDLMTAVNNDVGATFFFTFFLWRTVRLLQPGFRWRDLALALLATAACLYTKPTVFFAAPLLLLALMVKFLPWRLRWVLLAATLATLATLPLVFSWGDAASWLARGTTTPTRVTTPAPDGSHAFRLQGNGKQTPTLTQRTFLFRALHPLQGQSLTLHADIWSDRPLSGQFLIVRQSDNRRITDTVAPDLGIGTHPTPIEFPISVRPDTVWLEVTLRGSRDAVLYVDNVRLKADGFPPEINSALVRNPSAEGAMPRVRPWLEEQVRRYPWLAHLSPSAFLAALWDRNHALLALASAENIHRTFWAKFAWGGVSLSEPWYRWLRWVTLLGLAVGALWVLRRLQRGTDRTFQHTAILFGLTLLLFWGSNILRVYFSLWQTHIYIPVARYGYPAILPTMTLLIIGWWRTMPQTPTKIRAVVSFGTMLILDMWSLYVLGEHFYR